MLRRKQKGSRQKVRTAHRSRMIVAAFATTAGLAATAAMGCNGILGIDDRTLVEDTTGLSCQNYCDAIQAACTDAFKEYETPEACLATCAKLELGTADDTSGNTVGCRMRNVQLAKDTGELGDYCPISGPVGGGTCGTRCDNFCALYVPSCTGFAESADAATCPAFCQNSPDNPDWDPGIAEQKDHDASIQCRIWHLANAFLDPTLHCNHAAGVTKCEGQAGGTTSSSATGAGGQGGGEAGGEGGG